MHTVHTRESKIRIHFDSFHSLNIPILNFTRAFVGPILSNEDHGLTNLNIHHLEMLLNRFLIFWPLGF